MRRVKQVGGIPKAGLEAMVCAAKEVDSESSDGQSLLEFSGPFLVFLSVTYTFLIYFFIFNPFMFFSIRNFSSINLFFLMLVSAL